jgi:colicin import membrane protein
VQWKREAPPITVEAELWSALPIEAAPPAPEEPPPPEPAKPPPKPEPKPEPVVAPKPVVQPDPSIALAREKEKARQLKEKQVQQEKLAQEKKRLEQEKALKEKELQAKNAADKLAKEKVAKRAAEEAKAQDAERQKNVKRMLGMAGTGGSGDASSTGTAMQSSGASTTYAAKVGALVIRRITFTDTQKSEIPGNPGLDIDIKAAPDGTLLIPLIVKSSGYKAWDEAVLNAIKKLETLPRDADGKVPARVPLTFRPKD